MRRITRAADSPPTASSATEIARRFTARQWWPYGLTMRPGARVEAHYHPIDEELVVVRGAMTFRDLTNATADAITVTAGQALTIPEGTVHRVSAGEDGAEYVMGLPRPMPLDEFRIALAATPMLPLEALVSLVEINYHMAEVEETPNLDEKFFAGILSDRFVFVGVLGQDSLKKQQFLDGLPARRGRGRVSTNLRLRGEGRAVLASLVVTTGNDGRQFLNARLFELEDGQWRCVRWANTESSVAIPVPQQPSGGLS